MTLVYAVYALFSIALTVFLARTLSSNGQLLLEDVFVDNPALGKAVNKLLVVGFYLVNLGYACLLMSGGYAATLTDAIETLATKMGWLLMSLAAMHFANLYIFHRIRRAIPLPSRRRVTWPMRTPRPRDVADSLRRRVRVLRSLSGGVRRVRSHRPSSLRARAPSRDAYPGRRPRAGGGVRGRRVLDRSARVSRVPVVLRRDALDRVVARPPLAPALGDVVLSRAQPQPRCALVADGRAL